MKVAFIFSAAIMAQTNGIRSQALTWKKMLETGGHHVDMINQWDGNDWKSYDSICFFLFNYPMLGFVRVLAQANPNIYIAPILDPHYSVLRLKLISRWGCERLKLTNEYMSMRLSEPYIKGYLVRSDYEAMYMTKGFGIPVSKIIKVPLSFGKRPDANVAISKKEEFCLHISLLADPRKNVERLVKAAVKYKFNLKLGGKLRSMHEEDLIHSWIGNHPNIEYLGFLTDRQLEDYYCRAKVFALPSLFEGVGLVALEAAAHGSEIVITNQGGPKEYYGGKAFLVDPLDIDNIGGTIRKVLDEEIKYQPDLSKYILENYSEEACEVLLEDALFRNV